MAKIEIDQYGIKSYYNDKGFYYREDGPSVIFPNCTKYHTDTDGKTIFLERPDGRKITTHEDDTTTYWRPNGLIKTYDEDGCIWPKLR